MPEQIKKNPNDPDADQLNPDIIKLAHRYGYIRGPLNLFLHGDLTWLEALELMVLATTKEYALQNRLLIESLKEHGPSTTLALTGTGGLVKALPPSPLPRPVQREDNPPASEQGQDADGKELHCS